MGWKRSAASVSVRERFKVFAVVFAAVANLTLADAVAKEAAAFWLKGRAVVDLVPGFLSLAYVENRGCAWGMLQGQSWPLGVFGAVALAAVAWKRRAVFSPPGALSLFAEVLLYAGILGNMIDRFARGFVIDMIDVHIGAHHFPCFNLADAFISVAAAVIILRSLSEGRGRAGRGDSRPDG